MTAKKFSRDRCHPPAFPGVPSTEDETVTHLIAYDIADPKRLRRVARRVERGAVRVQKSVFLFRGSADALARLLGRVAPLLDAKVDVVQAWRLAPGQAPEGAALGNAGDPQPAALVLDSQVRRVRKTATPENP